MIKVKFCGPSRHQGLWETNEARLEHDEKHLLEWIKIKLHYGPILITELSQPEKDEP